MLITIRSTYIYYSTTIQYQIQYYYTSWEKWKSNLIMRREKNDRNLVMTFFWFLELIVQFICRAPFSIT